MQISRKGLDLIKEFEGWSPTIYKDVAGLATIGYGHLIKSSDKIIEPISKEEGERLLKEDIKFAEDAVNKQVLVPINQNQFDALVSFTFNLGATNLRNSTLIRLLNMKEYEDAGKEFLIWCRARINGDLKVFPGLLRRRQAEFKLWNTKE